MPIGNASALWVSRGVHNNIGPYSSSAFYLNYFTPIIYQIVLIDFLEFKLVCCICMFRHFMQILNPLGCLWSVKSLSKKIYVLEIQPTKGELLSRSCGGLQRKSPSDLKVILLASRTDGPMQCISMHCNALHCNALQWTNGLRKLDVVKLSGFMGWQQVSRRKNCLTKKMFVEMLFLHKIICAEF